MRRPVTSGGGTRSQGGGASSYRAYSNNPTMQQRACRAGPSIHAYLAVVAVPCERSADHDDLAGVGVDDDLVVGGVPIVLRLRGDGVVAGGDQVPSTMSTMSLANLLRGWSASICPRWSMIRSAVTWTPRTAGRAASSSNSCTSKPLLATPGPPAEDSKAGPCGPHPHPRAAEPSPLPEGTWAQPGERGHPGRPTP